MHFPSCGRLRSPESFRPPHSHSLRVMTSSLLKSTIKTWNGQTRLKSCKIAKISEVLKFYPLCKFTIQLQISCWRGWCYFVSFQLHLKYVPALPELKALIFWTPGYLAGDFRGIKSLVCSEFFHCVRNLDEVILDRALFL